MVRLIPFVLLLIILSLTSAQSSPVYLLIIVYMLIALSIYNLSLGLYSFLAGNNISPSYKIASATFAAIVTIALLLKSLRQLSPNDFILLGIFSLLTIIYIQRIGRQ